MNKILENEEKRYLGEEDIVLSILFGAFAPITLPYLLETNLFCFIYNIIDNIKQNKYYKEKIKKVPKKLKMLLAENITIKNKRYRVLCQEYNKDADDYLVSL